MVDKSFMTSFGEFERIEGPEETFVWSIRIVVDNRFFDGEIPLYILTRAEKPSVSMLRRAEAILGNMESYLETGISFLKRTLTEQADDFKISDREREYLVREIEVFPVDFPEVILYDDEEEWVLRFAEGLFSICDPYGININFSSDKPISLDNLEDSEEI